MAKQAVAPGSVRRARRVDARTARAPITRSWGPREEALAAAVSRSRRERQVVAPRTSIGDLLAIAKAARLVVSGDTGPMHLAAAVGTPLVGLFGPTNPARNGPFDPADESVDRFGVCVCHHERRCRRETACITTITLDEVQAAVDRRLASVTDQRPTPNSQLPKRLEPKA